MWPEWLACQCQTTTAASAGIPAGVFLGKRLSLNLEFSRNTGMRSSLRHMQLACDMGWARYALRQCTQSISG